MARSKTTLKSQTRIEESVPSLPLGPETEVAAHAATVPGGDSLESFVTYSANFEDVILHRIFAGRSGGFYIDVGAAHPIFENDTKLLSDAGWSGINVEPNRTFFELLVKERTRDINLNIALSDVAGRIDYYEVIGTGLSTCEERFAQQASSKGHEVVQRSVEVSTLAEVLDRAHPTSIELLKVDVEGFEERVFAGNDWDKYRPSVIVVEATFPETSERRPSGIRSYLETRNYRWHYFDGLNDFYVANEFPIPDDIFDRPPNIFDRFTPRQTASLEHEVAELNSKLANSRAENERLTLVLANEKFERYRVEKLSERLRQDIIAYSRDLKAAHLEAEELVHSKGINTSLKEQLARSELTIEGLREERARSEQATASLREELARGRLVNSELRAHVNALEGHVAVTQELRIRLEQCEAAYRSVLSSTSWAITGPLRAFGHLLKRLLRIVGA